VVGQLVVAVGTVEPFLAAGGANCSLDVDDVLAHGGTVLKLLFEKNLSFI
jgi:hypothetical protein